MTLAASLAPALLALALSQGTPPPPAWTGQRPATPAGTEPEVQPPQPSRTEDPVVTQGIPFMPDVAPARRPSDGVHLDAGILSELRSRSLVSDASVTWGTDVEVTPGLALEVGTPVLVLSVGYAPRLTFPLAQGGFELAVLNRGTVRGEWRMTPLWTASALGVFVVGDYSQLMPASTPGGAGPPPPVLNPIRSFQSYPYVGIDTILRLDGQLSRRSRLRLAGGYFDVGGTGPVGEANQPRAWGPQGEATFAWDASPEATLSTRAAGQSWIMSGNEYVLVATLTESWRHSWTPQLETTLGLGAGVSNREVESRTAAGKVVPVALASMVYRTDSRQPFRLSVDVGLSPYFDTYVRIPYQRITLGLGLDWNPSDAWRLGASFNGAVVPYSQRVPESYGTAGVSASYSPLQVITLSIGGFSQSQFQGAADGGGSFRQWTLYFSLGLADRFAF